MASTDGARAVLQAALDAQVALDAAARAGDAAACAEALGKGARASRVCDTTAGSGGETPLILASKVGSAECVDVLLKAGASHAETDVLGMTPLHAAASRGAISAVLALLEAGADVACVDRRGANPLRHAAVAGHVGCVRALLQAGSPVDRDTYSCAKEPESRYLLLEAVEKVDASLAQQAAADVAAKKAAKVAEKLASTWV